MIHLEQELEISLQEKKDDELTILHKAVWYGGKFLHEEFHKYREAVYNAKRKGFNTAIHDHWVSVYEHTKRCNLTQRD